MDTVIERLTGWDHLLLDDDGLDDALGRVLGLTQAAMHGEPSVSITVRGEGEPQTRAATDETGRRLDEWQYVNGQGPCVTADDQVAVCAVPSLVADDTFPDFAAVALDLGVRGVASFPLLAGDGCIGSLNVFQPVADVVDEEAIEVGTNIAATVAPLLANFLTHQRTRDLADQLQTALGTRATIERAKGLLMARLGVSADHAFELLSAQSQHENRKLREVAADLVKQHEDDVAASSA